MHFNSYSEAMNADAYEDMREYIVIDVLSPSFFPLICASANAQQNDAWRDTWRRGAEFLGIAQADRTWETSIMAARVD